MLGSINPSPTKWEREGPIAARRWEGEGLPLAEELAALCLRGLWGLHDLYHHRISGDVEVAHHRVGDVLDEAALFLERAAFDGVDENFGHVHLPWVSVENRYSVRERNVSPGRSTVLGKLGSLGEFGKCCV